MSCLIVSLHSYLLVAERGAGSSKRGCERCEEFSGKIVRKKERQRAKGRNVRFFVASPFTPFTDSQG
jgi:hypothetical protein